ncbi:hypothetical protein BXP70_19480 [Hymenobacter crusticola]|uniref:Uncharacterized protein n=1 Tax=Hymenobacter crusticola TaxID=1770526 RepID=A0A243WB10_9BACT|nr:hypothetical protein BXP70_19480 [Hymenobacter crusticola]
MLATELRMVRVAVTESIFGKVATQREEHQTATMVAEVGVSCQAVPADANAGGQRKGKLASLLWEASTSPCPQLLN